MKRIAPLLPLFMLAVSLIVHSCSQEAILSKEDAKLDLLSLKSSRGIDTTDSTDTIPTDTIPTDTIPTDSIWRNITGLRIVPSSISDSIVLLDIASTNFFPAQTVSLETFSNTTDSSWNIAVTRAYPVPPYAPGSARAQKTILHPRFTIGSRPFTITLRGRTFAGTLMANSNRYTITWAHDSVITIQPKTFLR